jgi:cyclophilin family peptidyl-prolyl cis-trans isomerase
MPVLKILGTLFLTASALLAQTPRAKTAPHIAAQVEPTGPTAVIDTSAGRITCRLYMQQAPAITVNFIGLADGSKDWTDPATGTLTHGKSFYDGVPIFGVSNGIGAGDRIGMGKGTAGPPQPSEKTGLDFERGGRLVMSAAPREPGTPKGTPAQISSSIFRILIHSDAETAKTGAVVFGQCDAASIAVVASASHTLLSTENHPDTPIIVRHITIVRDGEPTPPVPAPLPEVPSAMHVPPPLIPSPEPTGPTATIDTTMGKLTCRLFSTEAPLGVANFIDLANGTKGWKNPTTHAPARGRFYDGLTFRRVIPDFMIQNADLPGDPKGGGDIGFEFGNEIAPGLTFDRPGRLAYANSGPGTNSSQFFITEHAVSRLNGNYTIFGQCDDASVKVVEAIARVPRDSHNKPETPVVIRSVHITP